MYQKNKIVYAILVLILTFSLGLGIVMNTSIALGVPSCPGGKICHLVYDPKDNFWYCLGSPENCCCDFAN